VSDLPSYPSDAAEREAAAEPPTGAQNYASWGRRVGASLLDSIFMFVPLMVIVALALALGNPDDDDDSSWGVVGITYLASIVLPFFYYTIFHGRASGQTPGKRVLGIRVAAEDGESIGYGRAFGRYAITVVFAVFLFIPLLLDYLWPLWDTRNQALHDKVVGSFVFKT
jgi:uncharacterized RDD family membrane protein YckC